MKQRNHFFDIAKGIAVLMVIVTHYSWSESERLQYLFPFWISMAVPVFMIISGYLSAASFERNQINRMDEAYAPSMLMRKFIRYTIPFLIAYMTELVFDSVVHGVPSIGKMIKNGIKGGIGGAGTYYYPILVQFIFVFPVIYFIIKKKKHGLIICFLMNVGYEVIATVCNMPYRYYRLLIFRFIMLIAYGCYLSLYAGNQLGRKNWVLFIGGITFIVLQCYLGIRLPIISHLEKVCVFAVIYFLPVFSFLMEHMKNVKCWIMELLGRASYHIFFTQMVYYTYVSKRIAKSMPNRAWHLCFNIIFCVLVGLLFYYVESPISREALKASEEFFSRLKANEMNGQYVKKTEN